MLFPGKKEGLASLFLGTFRKGKVGLLGSSVRGMEKPPRPGPGPRASTGSEPEPPQVEKRSAALSTAALRSSSHHEGLNHPLQAISFTSETLHRRQHADCTSFLLNPVTSQRIMGCCKCPPTQQRPGKNLRWRLAANQHTKFQQLLQNTLFFCWASAASCCQGRLSRVLARLNRLWVTSDLDSDAEGTRPGLKPRREWRSRLPGGGGGTLGLREELTGGETRFR